MRTITLKDSRIPAEAAKEATAALERLYGRTAGIDMHTTIEERHFDKLPFEEYWGGNRGVKKSFLRVLAKHIGLMYGPRAFDHVVLLVHDENWTPKEDGIWGWNTAGADNGMEIQQVRFDPHNPANTLGTLYHENMHAHDQFVYRLIGERIERTVGVRDWDRDVVHGEHERFAYIRHKENTDALMQIGPALRRAHDKRELRHRRDELAKRVGTLTEGGGHVLVDDVNALIEWFRNITNRLTRSDQPIFKNNKCLCKASH